MIDQSEFQTCVYNYPYLYKREYFHAISTEESEYVLYKSAVLWELFCKKMMNLNLLITWRIKWNVLNTLLAIRLLAIRRTNLRMIVCSNSWLYRIPKTTLLWRKELHVRTISPTVSQMVQPGMNWLVSNFVLYSASNSFMVQCSSR